MATKAKAAYEPTTWADGDTITAEKLNKLEAGVANEQEGPAGPVGLGIKALALTTTDGKVTAGTVTFTDDTTAAVTVTEA
ncbi:hypothetical protein [Lactococcus petauri]|uniref:hypothetical protein n=1 Tax=Lactococcus petauri TaxID=1940789 RepID=UPI002550A1D5|nr:hypothetical protein [Lactococcus petauri]